MRAETIAEQLARQISTAMESAVLTPETIHAVERLILDSMACALGAADSPAVKVMRRWAKRIGGTAEATLLATGEKSSAMGAAMVNSAMIRDLDMNDTYFSNNPAHSSDNIGACLAVAEAEGSSTIDVIKSILIAFEVQMRCCEFTKSSFFKTRGWDQTTLVTIASAAAAGALLHLDQERLTNAIAIAGCYPTLGEVRVGQMSMLKGASAGISAAHGVEAAYLAKEGLTGAREVFEGQRGLGNQVLGECDWSVLTAPMDKWRLPLTCLKRYPAAYINHAAIDISLALVKEHGITPDKIEHVTVDGFGWLIEDMVNGMGGTSRYEVDERETADHSLPYIVAISLVEGKYEIGQLRARKWELPEVKAMMAKITCVHDKAMDAVFPPDRPSRVTIKLTNGQTVVKELPYPKGDYRDPFTDEELAAKFRNLTADVLSPAQQEKAIATALNFSKNSLPELIAACAPGR
ncbi:MmgE/PrpD family protein [Pigmentiphaga soli]|uniref:MmgE/PrpD family protein n=1 Tax=Pigmentiphaga soli TaxID=1007095 RepID=A0ABP8GLK0_9BURK